MNEGKQQISDEMWNKTTPVYEARWYGDDTFTIDAAFNTDTITLNRNEARRLYQALDKFLIQFPAIPPG